MHQSLQFKTIIGALLLQKNNKKVSHNKQVSQTDNLSNNLLDNIVTIIFCNNEY